MSVGLRIQQCMNVPGLARTESSGKIEYSRGEVRLQFIVKKKETYAFNFPKDKFPNLRPHSHGGKAMYIPANDEVLFSRLIEYLSA